MKSVTRKVRSIALPWTPAADRVEPGTRLMPGVARNGTAAPPSLDAIGSGQARAEGYAFESMRRSTLAILPLALAVPAVAAPAGVSYYLIVADGGGAIGHAWHEDRQRSEEHTSELQSRGS